MKMFRCWYKDGSARMVNQESHREAAGEAQELAGLANDLNSTCEKISRNRNMSPEEREAERRRVVDACKVIKTECLTDGTVAKWK